jgi:hypothetical protein
MQNSQYALISDINLGRIGWVLCADRNVLSISMRQQSSSPDLLGSIPSGPSRLANEFQVKEINCSIALCLLLQLALLTSLMRESCVGEKTD